MFICLYVYMLYIIYTNRYIIYIYIYIYSYLNKHICNKEYYFLAEDCCKNSNPFVYLSVILISY